MTMHPVSDGNSALRPLMIIRWHLALLGSAVALAATLFTSTAAWSSSLHAPKACAASGQTSCATMPASGAFRLTIPGTTAALVGTGTPDRAGKTIEISRAQLLCPTLGGFGIRISTPGTAGLLPPLRWSTGTLYARNAATGTCSVVTSPALAAAPGTYQVVAGTPSSVKSMPTTGGASQSRDHSINNLIALMVGLTLLVVGLVVKRQAIRP